MTITHICISYHAYNAIVNVTYVTGCKLYFHLPCVSARANDIFYERASDVRESVARYKVGVATVMVVMQRFGNVGVSDFWYSHTAISSLFNF